MDADLVSAAGVEVELDEGIRAVGFEDFVVGERDFAMLIDRHCAGFGLVFHDRQVDAAFCFGGCALDDAGVELFDAAFFEAFRQELMGLLIFCEDDDAAGVAIEAVYGEDITVFGF